jgi:carbamoyl-phosphate synthase large subunit
VGAVVIKARPIFGVAAVPRHCDQHKGGDHIAVLFTCIGRRVSLLNSFRQAARELAIKASFFGADTSELSSALQLCDRQFLVKPTNDPGYIRQLLSIVKSSSVRLLVPTVDLDLKVLAQNKAKFAAAGCRVLVSDIKVIDICQDKRRTYRFLAANGFNSPVTLSVRSALAGKSRAGKLGWPVVVKPWDGSAKKGTAVVHNRSELRIFAKRIPKPICQEYVEGSELTCDAYVDFGMNVRCVVPRRRIEVRSGEVSKGQVVKDLRIMSEVVHLVQVLGAGPGVITLQLFLTKDGRIRFIEINPRFGGGVPLSIKAGADFPKWILQELTFRRRGKLDIRFDGFKDGLVMLRYDDEVWLERTREKGGNGLC